MLRREVPQTVMMLTSGVLDLREDASVCSTSMQLLGRNRAIAGRIRTVRCFEGNALVKAAMTENSAGEVLVIASLAPYAIASQ
jgi:regulator of ribonuclease activity A